MIAQKRNLLALVAIVLSCLLPSWASAQYERDPAVIQAHEAGVAALQAEDWEGAIQEFDKAIAGDDTFPESHFGRAEALRELEDYENAKASYAKAILQNDKFAQAYNGRGICSREQGYLELALSDFRYAAEYDRRDPSSAANLGDLLVNNVPNGATQAMQYLDRAIEFNPEDAESFRNRGWAHALLKEPEEGIADLNKAIELDPEDYETYQRLASVLMSEEDYQPAIDAQSKAIEYYVPEGSGQPNTHISGYLQRANMRMTLAKQEEQTPEQRQELYNAVVADADAILEEFPDRYPESGIAQHTRGMALRMQGLFAEAITAFTDAIQLIPLGSDSNYSGEAYRTRGICWFYQGQNNLARGDFKEAASKSLEDPLPYLWIGYTQAEEGNYRQAIESYGEAAAKSPALALAHVNRGLAYMQLNDYDKAVDNFNEAIRAEPTEPKHFYKCGRAYELLEEPQQALVFFNLALHRDDQFADAHRGAARALRLLGRPNLADIEDSKAKSLP